MARPDLLLAEYIAYFKWQSDRMATIADPARVFVMTQSILISGHEVFEILRNAKSDKDGVSMSYLTKGHWGSNEVRITGISDETIHIHLEPNSGSPLCLQIDQPVGISLLQGFVKYIFETPILGFEPSVNQGKSGTIVLRRPENIERMQRRSYTRVMVPEGLNVRTLFWHRGYTDGSNDLPLENYWQGDLLDLSAGGLQIAIDASQIENFRLGQIVGLQFTPLPYEKPIVVEGQVKRIGSADEENIIQVGVEFLGVEVASEGREKLHRIIDTVNEYEQANNQGSSKILENSDK